MRFNLIQLSRAFRDKRFTGRDCVIPSRGREMDTHATEIVDVGRTYESPPHFFVTSIVKFLVIFGRYLCGCSMTETTVFALRREHEVTNGHAGELVECASLTAYDMYYVVECSADMPLPPPSQRDTGIVQCFSVAAVSHR